MADYNPENGLNILSNSSDPDGDLISVRKLGESVGALAVPGAYPATYNLTIGTITVINAQGDAYVTLASSDGTNKALGTLYFTTIDEHGLESATHGTVTINQIAEPSAPGYVDTGLIERWNSDAGVTLSGSDITSWTGQIEGLVLTATGTPAQGTPPGGTATNTVVCGEGGDNFTGSTLTNLPFGAQSRTVQMIWKPTGGSFFGGFGWGTDAADRSFIIALDDSDNLALDYKDGRVFTDLHPIGQWVISTATYDGTTIKVWIGDVLVASAAVALNTGTDIINVCRSFSGYQTPAEIGEILVYGRVLSNAEIAANVAYLNGLFIGSTTVASPSAPTGSVLAETSFVANCTVNSNFAVVAWSARASSTPATESEILAGTGAIDYGLAICDGTGTIAPSVTGGAASTNYYVNVIAYGLTGGKSSVVTSAAITTTAAPGANPILSSASLTATSDTTLSGSVSTDTGNGTLKYGLMLSTATTPTITQIEAGTDGDDAPLIGGLRTQTITATGTQNVTFAGATESTAYKVAYGQRDGSNNASNIVTDTATTPASSALTYAPDDSAATVAGVLAIIDAWIADPAGTAPSGKTATDTRVVQLTGDHSGNATINARNASAITGGIVVRGVGPYTWDTAYPYNPLCNSHISGKLTVSNCNNIQVYGLTCQQFEGISCTALVVDKISAQSRWSTSATSPSLQGGISVQYCPSVVVKRCHTSGFRSYSIVVKEGCDDAVVDSNYMEQWADDCLKLNAGSTTVSRVTWSRNWAGRQNLSPAGAHSDYLQIQGSNTPDMSFWGNCVLTGTGLTGDQVHFQGFLWLSNSNVSNNVLCEQNLAFIRGQNCYFVSGGTNTTCRDNHGVYAEYGAAGSNQPLSSNVPVIDTAFTTRERNLICRKSTGNGDTSGTDGVVMTVGRVDGGDPVNTSQYPLYMEGIPGQLRYIEEIKPPVGARTHWNYGGTKLGATERLEEIFSLGIHPENDGWPNAKRFNLEYNVNNVLPSTYTGTIDTDGNNA